MFDRKNSSNFIDNTTINSTSTNDSNVPSSSTTLADGVDGGSSSSSSSPSSSSSWIHMNGNAASATISTTNNLMADNNIVDSTNIVVNDNKNDNNNNQKMKKKENSDENDAQDQELTILAIDTTTATTTKDSSDISLTNIKASKLSSTTTTTTTAKIINKMNSLDSNAKSLIINNGIITDDQNDCKDLVVSNTSEKKTNTTSNSKNGTWYATISRTSDPVEDDNGGKLVDSDGRNYLQVHFHHHHHHQTGTGVVGSVGSSSKRKNGIIVHHHLVNSTTKTNNSGKIHHHHHHRNRHHHHHHHRHFQNPQQLAMNNNQHSYEYSTQSSAVKPLINHIKQEQQHGLTEDKITNSKMAESMILSQSPTDMVTFNKYPTSASSPSSSDNSLTTNQTSSSINDLDIGNLNSISGNNPINKTTSSSSSSSPFRHRHLQLKSSKNQTSSLMKPPSKISTTRMEKSLKVIENKNNNNDADGDDKNNPSSSVVIKVDEDNADRISIIKENDLQQHKAQHETNHDEDDDHSIPKLDANNKTTTDNNGDNYKRKLVFKVSELSHDDQDYDVDNSHNKSPNDDDDQDNLRQSTKNPITCLSSSKHLTKSNNNNNNNKKIEACNNIRMVNHHHHRSSSTSQMIIDDNDNSDQQKQFSFPSLSSTTINKVESSRRNHGQQQLPSISTISSRSNQQLKISKKSINDVDQDNNNGADPHVDNKFCTKELNKENINTKTVLVHENVLDSAGDGDEDVDGINNNVGSGDAVDGIEDENFQEDGQCCANDDNSIKVSKRLRKQSLNNNKNGDENLVMIASTTNAAPNNNSNDVHSSLIMIDNNEDVIDHDEEVDEDLMNSFDPTEVLKRMKVELKEEFDDSSNNNCPGTNTMLDNNGLVMDGVDACDNILSSPNHNAINNNNNNSNRINKNINYFGQQLLNYFDNEHFRKMFHNFSMLQQQSQTSIGSDLSVDVNSSIPTSIASTTPTSNVNSANCPQSSLAALTVAAAAAAAAAAVSPNFHETFFLLNDDDKKRILQSLIYKQLNGDLLMCNEMNSDLNGSTQILDACSQQSAISKSASTTLFQNLMLNNKTPTNTSSSTSITTMASMQHQPQSSSTSNQTKIYTEDAEHRFCSSCNIQFMSSKTYKVHKELYCSSRHHNLHHHSHQTGSSCSSSTSSLSSTTTTSTTTSSSNNNQLQPQQSHNSGNNNNNMTYGSNSSKSSSLANSQTSSGIGSSPPPSSFSSSPNSSSNSTSARKRASQTENDTNGTTRPGSNTDILLDDCNPIKYTDFRSLFPGLISAVPQPRPINGMTSNPVNTTTTVTETNLSGSNQESPTTTNDAFTPIYIVLSTNPLVLLPFTFNNATNSFEPLPSWASNLDPTTLENLKLFAPSMNSSLVFPSGNSNTANPFITTLEEFKKLDVANNLLNAGKQARKTEKSQIGKRSHSESIASNPDQPLDLSNTALSPKIKRSKSDSMDQEILLMSNQVKKESISENENNCEENSSTKDANTTLQEQMNNLLQKFAMMQSISNLAANQPESNVTPQPVVANVGNQLAAAAALARDHPALAQYIAMAMAALTGSNAPASGVNAGSATPNPIASTSPHMDMVMKQGNSHCAECNIVFYKHDNYLAHKRLYCASRRNLESSLQNRPISPSISTDPPTGANNANSIINNNNPNRPTSASSSSSSLSYTTTTPSSNKFPSSLGVPDIVNATIKSANPDETLSLSTSPSMLSSREAVSVSPAASMLSPSKQSFSTNVQYFCTACGIKYTSYDNLHAHQTYYCLKRNGGSIPTPAPAVAAPVSPATVVSPLPTSPVPAGTTPQSILTPQLLAAAAALGSQQTGAEGLLDFSSSTSLSQQWNALVQAAAAVGAKTGASLTNGLIGDYNCHKCKASYVSPETLAAHVCSADLRLEKPEKPANSTPSTSSLQTYKCTICGYKGHTMRGMRTHVRVHSEELTSSGAFEEDFIVQNTDPPEPSVGRRSSHGNSLTNPARQRRRSNNIDAQLFSCHSNASISSNETLDSVIRNTVSNYLDAAVRRNKEQQQEERLKNSNTMNNSDNVGGNGNNGNQQSIQNHNCQFCPYTSNYKGNVIRHIKLVHKEINGALVATLQHSQFVKEAIDGLMNVDLVDDQLSEDGHPKSPKLMNGIGTGGDDSSPPPGSSSNKSIPDPLSRPKSATPSPSPVNHIRETSNKSPAANSQSSTTTSSTNNNNNNNNEMDSKYCSACNISFTYRNSYLAHKRYYCSSHTTE